MLPSLLTTVSANVDSLIHFWDSLPPAVQIALAGKALHYVVIFARWIEPRLDGPKVRYFTLGVAAIAGLIDVVVQGGVSSPWLLVAQQFLTALAAIGFHEIRQPARSDGSASESDAAASNAKDVDVSPKNVKEDGE